MKKTSPFHWLNLMALALCLVLSAGCTKASKARRLLVSADRDYQAQKYDQAEIEYESVLRLSTLKTMAIREAAIRQLGFIYFEEGRVPKAFSFLAEALKQDTNNPEIQLKLAEIYGSNGDLKKGFELLGSVLHTDPGNEHALTLLAEMCPTNELANVTQRLETQLREGGQGAAACHSALGRIYLRTLKLSQADSEFQQASKLDPKLVSPYLGQVDLCSMRRDVKGMDQALKMAAELSPIRSSIRLLYAKSKLQIGADEEAKEMVSNITRQAPDYIPAWVFLMRVAFAEHKYDDCNTIIDRILARDSVNFDAMSESGTIALAQHDGPKAVSAFQRLNQVYRAVPQVKYNLAQAYLMNNEPQKALASLNNALALNHDYTPAVLLLASLDAHSDNSDKLGESASLLSQSAKNHPDDVEVHLALAETYLAQNQAGRALEVYKKMAAKFPQNAELHRLIGVVYFKEGDHVDARAAYEKSLELAPGYVSTLQEINNLDISEKRFDEALQRLAGLIKQNPKIADFFVMQGDIYKSEGQTNQAESAYSKAIELNPDLSAPYMGLSGLYRQSHQEQKALDRLEAWAAKHTNDIKTLQTIGAIQQTMGRYPQASDAYEKALTINSNSLGALNNLAYVDAEYLGKVDKGLELATRAKNLYPDDPTGGVADTLGWILLKKHEYAQALNDIQEAANKRPNDAEVQMHLGMAYYMMGEEKLAREFLQRALASPLDFPEKDLARRRLDILEIDPNTATPAIIQKLQAQIHDDPQDPMPWSRLAAIQEQHGEPQKAADSLQSLLSINPQDEPAIIRLSRLYADPLKDLRKALELAKSAHTLAPDDARASALLGELVYRSSDYPWSLSLLEEAARRLPDQTSLFYHLALAYYAVGRPADADAAMQKALEHGDTASNLDQAKQFLALRAAVKNPDHAEAAREQAQQILGKDPNNVPALMVSALLAERRGAADEAAQTYQKVLSIYPLFVPAMRQLAILYSRSQHPGDVDKAYALAEKARSSLPDDAELAKTLGVLTYRRADYERSRLLLRDYTDKSTNDGEALYYLGMDYYKLKQPIPSKKTLQRALEMHLSENLTDQARGVLKELK